MPKKIITKKPRYSKSAKKMVMYKKPKVQNQVHFFKRTAYFENFLNASTNTVGVKSDSARADILRLSDVPQYTEFTALFDQFKILKVVIKYMPRGNVSEEAQQQGIAQSTFSNLYSVIDKDDSGAPGSVTQMLAYSNVKTRRSNQSLTQVFVPATLNETYYNGLTSAYTVNMKPKWIDCSYPETQHFGYKSYLEGPNTASGVFPATVRTVFDCKITYYLAFKNVI